MTNQGGGCECKCCTSEKRCPNVWLVVARTAQQDRGNEVEGALVTSQLRKLEDWRTQHMSLLHMLEVGICVHLGQ